MPMKDIGLIGIIFFFVGCADSNQTTSEKSKKSDPTEKNSVEIPVAVTTEMTIMPVSEFPEPFFGDTTLPVYPKIKTLFGEMEDSMYITYHFDAFYPISRQFKHVYYNEGIMELVNSYFKQYRVSKGESIGGFYINAAIIATDFVSFENKYAGVLFTEQSYVDGAAHFNHGYLSFHYDFYRGKEINLTDIVIFKPGEAQKFCDAFNPDPTTTINETMLEGDDFSADRPFMTTYGELYLYFSDYEKGPSMTRVIIPYSKFKGYVNPDYKFLFEH